MDEKIEIPRWLHCMIETAERRKLLTSFVVEPGAALDSLLGDGVDVTVLQKQK
jgi:hypothetical protein